MKQLVQECAAALTLFGVDGPAIERAAVSYEKHKRRGVKKGLQSLGKGYHVERVQFDAMEKAGDGTKDAKFLAIGGSRVDEAPKAPKDLRRGYQDAISRGVDTQGTLALAVTDEALRKLLLSKDMHQRSQADFDRAFDAADMLGGMNTLEVNFLRKTERIGKCLTWCENGLFYQQVGHPYSSAGREIYAMDKYGNFITMNPAIFFTPGNKSYSTDNFQVRHNHASLNAGADVISAGEIEFQNGYITHIDNRSGHYKPTPKQVQNGVYCLRMADDADLSRLVSSPRF